MRLINTTTLKLEDILNPDAHPYAILSHTWEESEVTFQEWDNADPEVRRKKKGFAKIEQTCNIAKKQGLHYAWVDTCCINKESSAELTEAINSMFAWYRKAAVCFVYLSDLPAHQPEFPDPLLPGCRWFTRGWTLQELIAPRTLVFYDSQWNAHGGKRLRSYEIQEITGIDLTVLENSEFLRSMPVGRMMSWAAKRQTTREEDMAYCLLGIFDVNMGLIYGEGEKAFSRLQEEIMRKTNDMTLFAWTCQRSARSAESTVDGPHSQMYRGILARSPMEFVECREVIQDDSLQMNNEATLTYSGLQLRTSLAELIGSDYILFVGSQLVGKGFETNKIGIHLVKTPTGFFRRLPTRLFYKEDGQVLRMAAPSKICIPKDATARDSIRIQHRVWSVMLTFDLPDHLQLASIKVKPSNLWNSPTQSFLCKAGFRCHAVAHVRLHNPKLPRDRAYSRFALICELRSAPAEPEPQIIWSLAVSEADAHKCPAPWGELLELIDEYMGAGDETASVPSELAEWCARLAVAARAPQLARLETRRGVATGVALHIWPGELSVEFPTFPWWRRGEGRWHGRDAKGHEAVRAAVPLARRWTRSTLASDGSQLSQSAKAIE